MKRPIYINDPDKQNKLREVPTNDLINELAIRSGSILVETFTKDDIKAQVETWLNTKDRWVGRPKEEAVYRKCWNTYAPLIVEALWNYALMLYTLGKTGFDKVDNNRISEAFVNTINFYKIREWK